MNKKIILSFLIVIVISGFFVFKTEVRTVAYKKETYQTSNNKDYYEEDGNIVLKGYIIPPTDFVMKDSIFKYTSEHKKYGTRRFSFDMNSMVFSYVKINESKETKQPIIAKGKLINDGTVIASIREKNGRLLYKYSPDNSKLLYVNQENEMIAYNVKNDFKRRIKDYIPVESYEEFNRQYNFSNKAGYLSVVTSEKTLKVVGADTGRLYLETVFLESLGWLDDNNLFIRYHDQSENKVGIFNVPRQSIEYFHETKFSYQPIYYYLNDQVFFVEKQRRNQFLVCKYNSQKNVYFSKMIEENAQVDAYELVHKGNRIILSMKKNKGWKVHIFDLDLNHLLELDHLQSISRDERVHITSDKIFYKQENKLLYHDLTKQKVISEDNKRIYSLEYLESAEKLIAVVNNNQEYDLVIIPTE